MTGPTDLLQLWTAPHMDTCKALLIYFPKCPTFSTTQSYAPQCTLSLVSSWNLKSHLLVKRFLFLLKAAFYIAILDLISRVYLASFVTKLPKEIKYSTYSIFSFFWCYSPTPFQWARASSLTRFLDHTQRRTTVGRTPLDEWSVRRRDLYLTTHNTHNRQTSMPPVRFEPTISEGERPQTHALDRAATGTDPVFLAIIIFTGDSCFEILISLVLSTFLSIPQRLLTSINLSIMPYITAIITNSYRHMN